MHQNSRRKVIEIRTLPLERFEISFIILHIIINFVIFSPTFVFQHSRLQLLENLLLESSWWSSDFSWNRIHVTAPPGEHSSDGVWCAAEQCGSGQHDSPGFTAAPAQTADARCSLLLFFDASESGA